MNEIVTFIKDNLLQSESVMKLVVEGMMAAFFLRFNTRTKEFEKIKAGKFDEALEGMLKDGYLTYADLYKTRNFLKIAEMADDYYKRKGYPEVLNNRGIDIDWLYKFYNEAGSISDEDLQSIWGKIFSEEINEMGSISKRTLIVLTNLSKNEARIFKGLLKYVLECDDLSAGGERRDFFIPANGDLLDRYNIRFSDILLMSSAGLVICDTLLQVQIKTSKDSSGKIFRKDEMVIEVESKKEEIRGIGAFLLTEAGSELYRVLFDDEDNKDEVDDYLNYCRKIYSR